MSIFLHQIFYGDNKFDINEESLAALEQWAVIDSGLKSEPSSHIDRFFGMGSSAVPIDEPVRESYQIPKVETETIQTPSAFWCMFVANYGYSEYLRLGNRWKNRELEEKQAMMETLAKQPKLLKEGSMRLTHDAVQEILSTLMTSSSSDFLEIVAYAHYYQKNVYVVFEYSYLVFSPANGSDFPTVVLTQQPVQNYRNGVKYSLNSEPTPEILEAIRESKIALEHFAKPFRGVSSYKLDELETFARKVGILAEAGKKLKKGELYEKVVEKCCVGLRR